MSPFNFQNFNISELIVTLDGDSTIYKNFNFDFGKKLYLPAYNSLFYATGNRNQTNYIDRDDFIDGNSLFCFDILPSNQGQRFQLETQGQIKIQVKFKKAISDTISAIIYGQFQSLISIDEQRNVVITSTVH